MEANHFDVLEAELINRGCRIFAGALARIPQIRELISRAEIKLIFAPVDGVFSTLNLPEGQSISTILNTEAGRKTIENHISRTFSTADPLFIAISGLQYGLSQESLNQLGVVQAFTVADIRVIMINNLLVGPIQLKSLRQVRDSGIFGTLNYQNFLNIINMGGLKGRDLISFCRSNSMIDDFCNRRDVNGRTIFHRLMANEFNKPIQSEQDARDLYVRYSSAYDAYIYAPSVNQEGTDLILRPVNPDHPLFEIGMRYMKLPGGPYLDVVDGHEIDDSLYFGWSPESVINVIQNNPFVNLGTPGLHIKASAKIDNIKKIRLMSDHDKEVIRLFILTNTGDLYQSRNYYDIRMMFGDIDDPFSNIQDFEEFFNGFDFGIRPELIQRNVIDIAIRNDFPDVGSVLPRNVNGYVRIIVIGIRYDFYLAVDSAGNYSIVCQTKSPQGAVISRIPIENVSENTEFELRVSDYDDHEILFYIDNNGQLVSISSPIYDDLNWRIETLTNIPLLRFIESARYSAKHITVITLDGSTIEYPLDRKVFTIGAPEHLFQPVPKLQRSYSGSEILLLSRN